MIFPVVYKSRLEQATNFDADFTLRFFMPKLALVAKPADEKEENIHDSMMVTTNVDHQKGIKRHPGKKNQESTSLKRTKTVSR